MHTEIAYVLDRSGSMLALQQEAIDSFNQFVQTQREVPGQSRLTLVLFDNEYLVPHETIPLEKVPELTADTYVPRGSTALLDAIGRTINDTNSYITKLPPDQRPAMVIIAIFTDGLENSSRHYTAQHIADLIQLYRTEKNWQFIFLAANQDAVATGAAMNIARESSGGLEFHARGLHVATSALNRKVRALRKQSSGNMDAQDQADLNASMNDLIQEEDNKLRKEQD